MFSLHEFMNIYSLVSLIHVLLMFSTNSSLGDPTVASVWRRQTFSAAVESFTPEMSTFIINEHIPTLAELLAAPNPALKVILDSAYNFSRMLHASKTNSGGSSSDAFYRAFVPELGSVLYPRQIELLKRCRRHEMGQIDRVGACVFPVRLFHFNMLYMVHNTSLP